MKLKQGRSIKYTATRLEEIQDEIAFHLISLVHSPDRTPHVQMFLLPSSTSLRLSLPVRADFLAEQSVSVCMGVYLIQIISASRKDSR